MAEPNDPLNLAAAWKRLTEANLRYYSGYAKLAREYVDEVVASFQGARRASASGPIGAVPTEARARPAPAPAAPEPSPPPAMALEGRLGSRPAGAFVVENGLDRRVRTPLLASSFKGPAGAELSIPLTFEPAEIDLEAGDQVLVRVTAAIDDSLEHGVVYRGDVTVPGLPGTRVGLVVRRDGKRRPPKP